MQAWAKVNKLYIIWVFLDLCLLAAGCLCIAISSYFHSSDHLIVSLVFERVDFRIGIILGSLYILACLLSVPAIMQSEERPVLLKTLSIVLIGLSIVTVALGTVVWFLSLCQLETFSEIWASLSPARQQIIQDEFSCCGYWNGTVAGQLVSAQGFCQDPVSAMNSTGCQTIITSASSPGSDYTLENIFSSIYGFEAIIGFLFLATLCIIKERQVEVRFTRIDEKRGGGGFV